ncbi:MAG: 30S ribosomal protein S17 [Candidatus Hodarchaeaceae archaeon]|nr:30S ribosomal protein S17 [Candidatus Hodarchaeaceae archaeon]
MVGLNIEPPKERCSDENCPFHGTLSVRGRIFEGTVTSDKTSKTVTVELEYMRKVAKYERYERRTSKLHVHSPPCINARVGDKVRVMECRRLSKTKSFVVVQRLGG